MKGICYNATPILGSSAGYRENRSLNRMIRVVLGLNSYCPKMHLTPLTTAEFQSSVAVSHILTLDC